jgi:hypothetical protein
MQNKNQIIICSANLDSCDFYENQERQKALAYNFREIGVAFNSCQGVYKGKKESSFIVVIRTNEQFEQIKNMCLDLFEQDSILYQEISGLCSLIYTDKVEKLGELVEVEFSKAKTLDNYTEFNGKYYATN